MPWYDHSGRHVHPCAGNADAVAFVVGRKTESERDAFAVENGGSGSHRAVNRQKVGHVDPVLRHFLDVNRNDQFRPDGFRPVQRRKLGQQETRRFVLRVDPHDDGTVPLHDGVGAQPGSRGDLFGILNIFAGPIDAEAPVMEGAPQAFVLDRAALTQVRAQVWA
jgi:hypothetical protein